MTHPFHPLRGRRLRVLFLKKAPGREPLVVCAGPPGAQVYLGLGWTDLAPAPAAGRVSVESLAALAEATRHAR
ncbi:MAG: Y4bD/Y4pK family protein [Bifidobacteriaceae bacterium]|nr:Y4bD/Y4pK family protein [Bifidobacteriaceae bacterium]